MKGEIATDCLQIMIDADVPAVDLVLVFDNTLNGKKPLSINEMAVSGDTSRVLADNTQEMSILSCQLTLDNGNKDLR